MSTQDTDTDYDGFTVAELVEVAEVIEHQGDSLGPFGALLGGLDLPAMLAGMGVELPDPDAGSLDDVLDELAELRACVDWIAAALIEVAAKVPAKWRPTLAAYPPPVEV